MYSPAARSDDLDGKGLRARQTWTRRLWIAEDRAIEGDGQASRCDGLEGPEADSAMLQR